MQKVRAEDAHVVAPFIVCIDRRYMKRIEVIPVRVVSTGIATAMSERAFPSAWTLASLNVFSVHELLFAIIRSPANHNPHNSGWYMILNSTINKKRLYY